MDIEIMNYALTKKSLKIAQSIEELKGLIQFSLQNEETKTRLNHIIRDMYGFIVSIDPIPSDDR